MLFQIILTFHVLLALGLIAIILLQQGKGADAGAAFGSGSAGSVFGASGSGSFLYKLTRGLALSFFVTSLLLAYLASDSVKPQPQNTDSLIQQSDIPTVATPTEEVPQVESK